MRDDNHLEARAERKAYAAMQTDPAVELFEHLIQVRAVAGAYVRTIAHHRRHWGNGYGAELFEL